MTEYVAGFLFTEDYEYVVLINKLRPDWQKGLLNGVGGHVEQGEMPFNAMCREFKEETGVTFDRWTTIAQVSGPDWYCTFFAGASKRAISAKTMTDEEVGLYPVTEAGYRTVIPNISWLIPLSIDRLRNLAGPASVVVTYGGKQ